MGLLVPLQGARSLDQFHVMLFVVRKKAAGGYRKPSETNARHAVLGIPGVFQGTGLISTCRYGVQDTQDKCLHF